MSRTLDAAAVILSGLLANPDNSPNDDAPDSVKAAHRRFLVSEAVTLARMLDDEVANRPHPSGK